MKKTLLIALAALCAAACAPKATDYVSFVNPRIGSGGHGHVFVGANVPFGMVQLGPTSIPQEWDWCSGYHASDSTAIGFSHTHLSGTGIGDLFDVTVMPVTGEVRYARGREDDPASGLWSYADRSREITEPGYYSVPLLRYGVRAELTATSRVGMHRYTFPESDDAAVVLDLENGGCWDSCTGAAIAEVRDAQGRVIGLEGYRYSSGWAQNQQVYFYMEFSRPAESVTLADGRRVSPAYARYQLGETKADETLLLKVAISPVSIEGAKRNMAAELPGWDFEAVRADARKAWNAELSKIAVESKDADALACYYTALYHTMIAPSDYSDVDGQYRGADGKVHRSEYPQSTTFSLWDTYRAQMPLMTIIQPERMDAIVNTMYNIYREQGDLPVWHLWGWETNTMCGNPGLISFADALIKGFGKITPAEAMQAMVESATQQDRGMGLRMQYGFIPSDLMPESVAHDMEYAIADGALANAADYFDYLAEAARFRERSHSYRHYFDPETGFIRGRKADGSFTEPFNPIFSAHETSDYMEGTAWQYLWLVPQDIEGLVELFGSREKTLEKLDGLFEAPSEIEGENASPDISGLIGQYAHGNEPGHHTIYLYTMLGAPDKAADRLAQVYQEMYFNDVEGLAGNEDVGEMSAWYVLSGLGFYEVEPASTRFWFGLPLFEKAAVKVAGGTFTVSARGLSPERRHIRGVTLNGQPYDKPYIEYADIVAGGELVFTMGE